MRTTSKRTFVRHFGEMVLAMFLGMAVLGGLAELIFRAAGSSVTDASGAVRVLIMGFNMTLPMVAWMRYRRHRTTHTAEMAGAMVVPSLFAAALAAGDVLDGDPALALQHVVMIPAMLGVMLLRYDVYALGAQAGQGHRDEAADGSLRA